MISGYFVLGGPQLPRDLPLFAKTYKGNHVGNRNRGQWVVDSGLFKQTLNIPSRGKSIELLSSTDHELFAASMATLDSEYGDVNYRSKLQHIQNQFSADFIGMVNNISTSTHGSLAIICNDLPVHFWGLYATEIESAYLLWSTSVDKCSLLLEHSPLHYLQYRMPTLHRNALFLPGEVICARWWRLLKNHSSHLYAYNALERKLFS
jgi:hypothetical protein